MMNKRQCEKRFKRWLEEKGTSSRIELMNKHQREERLKGWLKEQFNQVRIEVNR
jgi:hypothetical protein